MADNFYLPFFVGTRHVVRSLLIGTINKQYYNTLYNKG